MKKPNDRYEKPEIQLTKSQRRTFKNPWFWVAVAALIIIPLTVAGYVSNDSYNNYMAREGCKVVNTFSNGTRVWECEKQR